ncbi:PEP-CTERM sorting domain-containing protein [Tolypothrix sp. FACHB-123]|uniref:PEP-CTERM sorting domain-containing protein n=1 Tax=Tolypothrix sp. FACHB-123 TaxID=2692868 RepID=UPI001688B145|nr:PEP-CTERM sorting domain-containing protein [Tolypothrix sp. FACHB-123]MBD2354553.1 PEP-CTERM sorting domain-containing protein [Tolypothrix sp. FACHB-123]
MTRFKIRKKLWKVATLTVISCATFPATNSAQAASFTLTSPTTKGVLPTEITSVGGVVLDIVGQNNTRVTSQLGASQLFKGYYDDGAPNDYLDNPGTIGIDSNFTQKIINALGGGIKELAVRFTLDDGDSGIEDKDAGKDNTLLVNNIAFGYWGEVDTKSTDAKGNEIGTGFGKGFRSETLDTGWFYVNDASTLSDFYTSLVNTQKVVYQLHDEDPYDNYYGFKKGINKTIIKVTPPESVPEPLTIFGTLTAGAFGVALRRQQKQQQKQ